MFERLRQWWHRPVIEVGAKFDELLLGIAVSEKELAGRQNGIKETISKGLTDFTNLVVETIVKMPDYSTQISELRAHMNWPRLSVDSLMAWEAVNYAAGKWERDPLEESLKLDEVTRWTNLFLAESGRTAVDRSIVSDFLALRGHLRKTRYSSL